MQPNRILTRTFYGLILLSSMLGVLILSFVLVLPMNVTSAQPPTRTPLPDRVSIAEMYQLPLTADVEYLVQPRDTLEQIAAAFDVRLDCIRETNELKTYDILQIGQKLVISIDCPAYDGAGDVIAPRLDSPGRTGEDGSYVVRPSDTLDTIGQTLNVSVIELLQANDLREGRSLKAGDVLVIPEDAAPYGEYPVITNELNETTMAMIDNGELKGEQYVIQPNDTLDVIAQEFNVSVVAIRVANNINAAGDIVPGQLIVIPEGAPEYTLFPSLEAPAGTKIADGTQVVIQPGDTLDHIAAQYNVDTLCLIEANDIRTVRLIQPGQLIGIPSGCPAYSGFDVVPATPPTEG